MSFALTQGMVMVSPEMDPTICWMFEAEIVLLFHAKTFHKGFQVTVHIGNVRQTATVAAVYDKVSSSTRTQLSGKSLPSLKSVLVISHLVALSRLCPTILRCVYDTSLYTGGAEDRRESSGSLQVHQAPRIPEGWS